MNYESKSSDYRSIFHQVVSAISVALDFENGENLNHGARVAVIAWHIGKHMNLEDAGWLYYAGLLHDIGGINLESHILHYISPHYVDPKVLNHPTEGANILRPFKPFTPLIPIIENHHENYDGSGFPNNKKGNEIPLNAYIINLADQIDVMYRDKFYSDFNSTTLSLLESFNERIIPKELYEQASLFFETNPDFLSRVFNENSLQRLMNSISSEPISRIKGGTRVEFLTQILWVFSRIIDLKHYHTMGHSVRTTMFAFKIVSEFPENLINKWDLIWAGLMHDVGEVGIPERILKKAGPLTEYEKTVVQKHARDTINVISKISEIEYLAYSSGSNHEWYDGTGYPFGNRGEDIPLIGRVIALADAYDAMRSERPHRNARSHLETISIIDSLSGTQFDPAITKIAIKVFNKHGDSIMGMEYDSNPFFKFFKRNTVNVKAITETITTKDSTLVNVEKGVVLVENEKWLRGELDLKLHFRFGVETFSTFLSMDNGANILDYLDSDSGKSLYSYLLSKEKDKVFSSYLFSSSGTPFEVVIFFREDYFDFLFRSAKNKIAMLDKLSNFYRNFISSSEAVIFTDKTGKITDVNRKFLDLYKFKIKDVIGKTISIIKGENSSSEVYKDMLESLSRNMGSWVGEIITYSSDQTEIICNVEVQSIKDASGETIGFIGHLVDITEKMKAIAALKESKERYRQKNRELETLNDLKSDMVSITSHDLKSPINTILTIVNYLKENLDSMDTEQIKYFISQIEEKGNKSIKFISEMLNLAKMETGLYEPELKFFNLSKMVHESLNDHKEQAKSKNIIFRTFFPHTDIFISGDKPKLEQVFNNIISNAVKFSGINSTVDTYVKINDLGNVEISIDDSGVGIPEEELLTIFNKYYQVNKDKQKKRGFGSGLGLYIAKNIVELHKGKILAKRRTAGGTRFTVEIPIFSTSNGLGLFNIPDLIKNQLVSWFPKLGVQWVDIQQDTLDFQSPLLNNIKTILLGNSKDSSSFYEVLVNSDQNINFILISEDDTEILFPDIETRLVSPILFSELTNALILLEMV